MRGAHVLVSGAGGQIGTELVPALQAIHGHEAVLAVDRKDFDIRNKAELANYVAQHQIGVIYHLASLLSVTSEANPSEAWDINVNGLKNVLDVAAEKKLQVFWPSSIAAFGPDTPKQTPQTTIQNPTKVYGITKVTGELLCRYYFEKFGVDVRSVRYPGVMSWKQHPGGGTTDWAVEMFHAAAQQQPYACFVSAETKLPMIYIDDAVRAALQLMAAPAEKLTVRTAYNIQAFSVTPELLAEEIRKSTPLTVTYTEGDPRQQIANTWPQELIDEQARTDWGWHPGIQLHEVVPEMLAAIKNHYGQS